MRYNANRRRVGALALGGLLALAAGCDGVDKLLQAENPARINERDLDNKALVPVLVNSVIGEYQRMYANEFVWRGSLLTDEQVTGINDEQTARVNKRVVRYDEGSADLVFSRLSASRMMGDTVSGRLRTLLENPNSDARLATTLAYAGYSYVLMAEAMCASTIDLSGKIHTPKEMFQLAIPRLEESLKIALAANNQAIANLARVGLARAHLGAGNKAQVMQAAAQVPLAFTRWVEYSDAHADVENGMFARVTGSNHQLGVHPKFLNGPFGTQNLVATQTDPRIQHTPSWSLGHNRLTRLYKPFQSWSYSGYNGQTQATGGTPILYERTTDIRMASGLEAMHHYYEAAGPNGTGPLGTTLQFVNSRRAVGNQPAVTLSGAALMAELREQRGRDLYLGGFRLGDLRRWKAEGTGDFFPRGPHPNAEWGQYEDATCFPIPRQEYDANPKLPKPTS